MQDAATGDGPVDAVFKCLERITGVTAKLQRLQRPQRLQRQGRAGRGRRRDRLPTDCTYHGKGVSTDIIEASAQAYLQALNKAASTAGRVKSAHPQHGV